MSRSLRMDGNRLPTFPPYRFWFVAAVAACVFACAASAGFVRITQRRQEIVMKIAAIVSVLLMAYSSTLGPVRAADSCTKDCSDYYQACSKNHSQAACKSERD